MSFHLQKKVFKQLPFKRWSIKTKITGLYCGQERDYTGVGIASYTVLTHKYKLLYREDLKLDQGSSIIDTFKEYLYVYEPKLGKVGVFFVDIHSENKQNSDRLFHYIDWDNITNPCLLSGQGNHSCRDDSYQTYYKFNFLDSTLINFNLKHIVKGPKKDYMIESNFIDQELIPFSKTS